MKKFTKTLIAFSLCIALWGSQICIAAAQETPAADTETSSETEETVDTEVVYDLEEGGTQVFHLTEEDGTISEIVIEPVPSVFRINNGAYKISKTVKNRWSASFYVSISSNKITKAYNKSCKALTGKITASSLVRNSSAKATLGFTYKQLYSSNNISIIVTIKSGKLNVVRI